MLNGPQAFRIFNGDAAGTAGDDANLAIKFLGYVVHSIFEEVAPPLNGKNGKHDWSDEDPVR